MVYSAVQPHWQDGSKNGCHLYHSFEVGVEVVQDLADAHHLVVVGGRLAVDACALRLV